MKVALEAAAVVVATAADMMAEALVGSSAAACRAVGRAEAAQVEAVPAESWAEEMVAVAWAPSQAGTVVVWGAVSWAVGTAATAAVLVVGRAVEKAEAVLTG